MKVLIIPAWFPSSENPVYGTFVEEFGKAVALYDEVKVLYVHASDRVNRPKLERSNIKQIEINYIKYPVFFNLQKDFDSDTPLLKIIRRLKHLFGLMVVHMMHSLLTWVGLYKTLKMGWKPDIINVHAFYAGVMPIIIGRLYKIPVAITEHYTGFVDSSLSRTEMWKAKLVMRKANLVLPVSRSLEKSIKRNGIVCQSTVVPNIVNTALFYYQKSRIGNRTSCRNKKMLTVSSLIPHKGIDILIRALGTLLPKRDDFFLDIVGDGPLRDELEYLAHTEKVDRLIKFHGSRPKEIVAEFMQNCDFFVLPSLKETFSVVTIEALACGKPVVASDIPGPNEIITSDAGVLVKPGDVGQMAHTICHMLDHYGEYNSRATASSIRRRYSYVSVGRQLHDIFMKLCGEESSENTRLTS